MPVSSITFGFLPVKENQVEHVLDDDAFFPDVAHPLAVQAFASMMPFAKNFDPVSAAIKAACVLALALGLVTEHSQLAQAANAARATTRRAGQNAGIPA